jgi:hypothetical protein
MLRTLLWLALLAAMSSCCTAVYRYDGARYYKAVECPWGTTVECDSVTRLPDPATWTDGCR